ncbi:DUF5657 family protein [Patescibacteria group bacterium]
MEFFGITFWAVVKIFVLILLVMYIIFSVVVVRQVQLMTKALEVGFETQLRFLSFAHLIFAVIVFFIALAIL